MTGVLTAGVGKLAKPTARACAQARAIKENMPVPGIMVSKFWGFTLGPAVTLTRVTGPMVNVTILALKQKVNGNIKGSGAMDSRGATVLGATQQAGLNTKELGAVGFRTVTGPRRMEMEVSFFFKYVEITVLFFATCSQLVRNTGV